MSPALLLFAAAMFGADAKAPAPAATSQPAPVYGWPLAPNTCSATGSPWRAAAS